MIKIITEKFKEYAFHAFLFLAPIFFIANELDSRIIQQKFFHVGAMALCGIFFGNIWITLFLWLNIILFLFHGADVGSAQVFNVFLTGLLFACSRNFFKERPFSKYVLPLYIVTVISIIFMILQIIGIDPLHAPVNLFGEVDDSRSLHLVCGLFKLPAFHAIFLTLISSLMIFISGWVGFLLIIPVIMSKCAGAGIAYGFLIPFYIYHKFKKLFLPSIFIGIIASAGYLIYDRNNDALTFNSRFEAWSLVLKQSCGNLLGYGPDSFRQYNKNKDFVFSSDEEYNPILRTKKTLFYYSANLGEREKRFKNKIPKLIVNWTEAHNEYLQFLFEYGVFGIILLFGFCREIYDRYVLSEKSNEVLALFSFFCVLAISSTTQFPFHLARLTAIFGVILGAYFSKTDRGYELKES